MQDVDQTLAESFKLERPAGALIDGAGLKGLRIGGAKRGAEREPAQQEQVAINAPPT